MKDPLTVQFLDFQPAIEQIIAPMIFQFASGDFTVAGLTDGGLSFSFGAERQTFTVTATEDDDTVDETVLLGFGDLPEEVSAGTPASATVTLFDDDVGTSVVSLSTTTPQVGQRMTATLTDFDGHLEAVAWQWQRRADAGSGWVPIERSARNPDLIADLSRYTPVAADRGKQLRATVSYTDAHGPGSAQSAATDAVTWPPLTVTYGDSTYSASEGGAAATLTVRLSAEAEQLVKIPITRDPASGDYTVTWPGVEDTLSFSGSATSQSFTVTATEDDDEDDETVLVGFGALPERVEAGTPASATVTLVDDTDHPGTVRLSTASPEVGQRVTATLTDFDGGLEAVAWQWQRRADAGSGWVPIERSARYPITDLSRYTPVAADRGKQLRATVGYTDAHGPNKSAQSAATSAVRPADTPGTVRLVDGVAGGGSRVTATLTDVDGGLEAVAWQWQRRADANSGWVPIERSARYPIAATSRYTPVTADVGKQLRARVDYDDGHGPDKAAASGETAPVVTVPSVPRDFTAEAGNRQVVLSWRAPVSDGGLSLTGYEYRRRAGSGSWSGWTGVGTNTTRTVTGLSNGTIAPLRGAGAQRGRGGCGGQRLGDPGPAQPGPVFHQWPHQRLLRRERQRPGGPVHGQGPGRRRHHLVEDGYGGERFPAGGDRHDAHPHLRHGARLRGREVLPGDRRGQRRVAAGGANGEGEGDRRARAAGAALRGEGERAGQHGP